MNSDENINVDEELLKLAIIGEEVKLAAVKAGFTIDGSEYKNTDNDLLDLIKILAFVKNSIGVIVLIINSFSKMKSFMMNLGHANKL